MGRYFVIDNEATAEKRKQGSGEIVVLGSFDSVVLAKALTSLQARQGDVKERRFCIADSQLGEKVEDK